MVTPEQSKDLLERARDGDGDALEELLEAYRAPLEAHIRMRLGDHLRQRVDVEDVCQEALLQAVKSVRHCRAEGGAAFLRWLKGVAEHVILKLARHQRGDRILFVDHDAPATGPTPSRALRREERMDRLQEALDGLSEDYRTAIRLVRLEGLQVKEAAERMGRTPKAVTQLLGRALRKLRDAMGDTESLALPPDRDGEGEDRQND